jgi:cytoskeletal protein CcmA (bactofilin family)
MWNKREEEPVRPPSTVAGTLAPASSAERREGAGIGPSINIVGDVTGEEDLTILGRVEGKIDLPKHSVTIGQGARVKADVHAKAVSVAGEVHGNLVASEQIVIRKTATMLGNLAAPRVGLEDGCCFRGSVEMETPPPKGRVAPVTPTLAAGGSAPAGAGAAAPKAEPPSRP